MSKWDRKTEIEWNRVRGALADLYPYVQEYLSTGATQLDFAKWGETVALGREWERNDFRDGGWSSIELVLEAARARKVADALEALLSHYHAVDI